jgi:DNA-binding MarR family transcriptional regulator
MVLKQDKSQVVTTPQPADSLARAVSRPSANPAAGFYCPDDYKPNDSVGYLMRRIMSLVSQGVERELEPAGLTNAQWVPLLKLQMGAASTVAELARECDLDAGSMTRLLDRLEAKGLCRRVRSLEDRRVVNLELTDAGRVAAKEIPVVLCRLQNQLLNGFSEAEWQLLRVFLHRILDTAQTLPSVTGHMVPPAPGTPVPLLSPIAQTPPTRSTGG